MSDNLTTTENQVQLVKIVIEKLEGGYISNATGKRAIHKDAYSVADALGIEEMIKAMPNDEYHMDIVFVPKDTYREYEDLIALGKEELTLESAKENGIIEAKEEFNPLPAPVEPDINAPIKVTIANAYTIERLKGIDWQALHEQLPLLPSEITKITGMNTTTLYAALPKARKGAFTFMNTKTRVGFTILAQYYEKTLNIRTSTKDACEKMKEDLGKMIRTLEVLGSGKSHVKTSEVQKILLDMRKTLM